MTKPLSQTANARFAPVDSRIMPAIAILRKAGQRDRATELLTLSYKRHARRLVATFDDCIPTINALQKMQETDAALGILAMMKNVALKRKDFNQLSHVNKKAVAVLVGANRFEEAISRADQAFRNAPIEKADLDFLTTKARLCIQIADYQEAKDALNTIFNLGRVNNQDVMLYALATHGLGEFDAFTRAAEMAYKLDPQNAKTTLIKAAAIEMEDGSDAAMQFLTDHQFAQQKEQRAGTGKYRSSLILSNAMPLSMTEICPRDLAQAGLSVHEEAVGTDDLDWVYGL